MCAGVMDCAWYVLAVVKKPCIFDGLGLSIFMVLLDISVLDGQSLWCCWTSLSWMVSLCGVVGHHCPGRSVFMVLLDLFVFGGQSLWYCYRPEVTPCG